MLRRFVMGSLVIVTALRFAVIQVTAAKPSGMGKLRPEGGPAAAGIFAAASVCVAADSVFVGVFVVVAVIGALGRLTVDFRITVAAAAGIIGHSRDLYSGSIRGNIFRRSILMSHKNTAILRADFSSTCPARKTGRTDKDVCFLLYDGNNFLVQKSILSNFPL